MTSHHEQSREAEASVHGRTYLVCGASSGLGRAVADEILARGGRVWAVARRPALADNDSSKITRTRADLTTAAGVESVAQQIVDAGQMLDGVLINGPGPRPGELFGLTGSDWHEALESLLIQPLHLISLLADRLAPGSSIVFVTSSTVREPIPRLDASNVLRPAVAAAVNVLSKALAPRVRVNSIAPGRIATSRLVEVEHAQAAGAHASVADVRAGIVKDIPLGRYGTSAEFAAAAVFLLSPESAYITGAALQVDGGLVRGA
ncbi:SDR family oxidoreductase [Amycolatopsis pithecellobii]|uniref:SDR family oxidoreductase n=1 Tax=Amycolatopsis pithecellobii TaxID=664692 RepID=A0A6N7Z2I8_9PSEU|nr:SDR family oxidoreductase [Amycolatopsis pithecellobii]MTD54034.1 SDR family oxidoreductase [Amycolatopsis pithecellobii]